MQNPDKHEEPRHSAFWGQPSALIAVPCFPGSPLVIAVEGVSLWPSITACLLRPQQLLSYLLLYLLSHPGLGSASMGSKLRQLSSNKVLSSPPRGHVLSLFLLNIPDVDVGVHRAGDQEIWLKHCPVQVAGRDKQNNRKTELQCHVQKN